MDNRHEVVDKTWTAQLPTSYPQLRETPVTHKLHSPGDGAKITPCVPIPAGYDKYGTILYLGIVSYIDNNTVEANQIYGIFDDEWLWNNPNDTTIEETLKSKNAL